MSDDQLIRQAMGELASATPYDSEVRVDARAARALLRHVWRLRSTVEGLAARVADQAELLERRAERENG